MKTNKTPYEIFSYIHHNRQIATLVTIRAQTDFALKTEILQDFGTKLAKQVTANGALDMQAEWLFGTGTVSNAFDQVRAELKEEVVIDQVHVHR